MVGLDTLESWTYEFISADLHSNMVGLDTACASAQARSFANLHSNMVGLDTRKWLGL